MRKVNCDVNECNKVDGNDENKHNESARRLLIDNTEMNTITGVKNTEVVSTGKKENGSDKGQTKLDSEAAKPNSIKALRFQMSIHWFPGDKSVPQILGNFLDSLFRLG